MIKFDFENKNVIVTGASMGLGKAIVKAKANMVIADLNEEEALKTKAELEVHGTKIITYTMDVSNYEAFEGLVDRTSKELRSIDILVNNAGIFVTEPLVDMNVNTIDKMIKININGIVYLLTIASVLERTACLAREYAKDPINVNTVLPGFVRTPLWGKCVK